MKWNMAATWDMALEGVKKGMAYLETEGDIRRAVVTAVREVEDNGTFTSVGYGGLPNRNGLVELDAAFMDGDTLDAGGVMAAVNIRNPIEAAYRLSRYRRNSFLAGEGACEFAREQGLEFRDMLTRNAKERYEQICKDPESMRNLEAYEGHDTVCIIGRSQQGTMACGVSTSGLFMKHAGRVGDSPVIGSGFYADSLVGSAAATGVGEEIMKGCLSFSIVEKMRNGMDVQTACTTVLSAHLKRLLARGDAPGSMSVIAMDREGNVGAATNLPSFPFVVGNQEQECRVMTALQDGRILG